MASHTMDFASDDARWAAVQARAPRADGASVSGVKATGIDGQRALLQREAEG